MTRVVDEYSIFGVIYPYVVKTIILIVQLYSVFNNRNVSTDCFLNMTCISEVFISIYVNNMSIHIYMRIHHTQDMETVSI